MSGKRRVIQAVIAMSLTFGLSVLLTLLIGPVATAAITWPGGVLLGVASQFVTVGRRVPHVPQWAVVQDLRPFGFKVESKHQSRRRAESRAASSPYLTVQSLDYIAAENKRLSNYDEIMADIVGRRRTVEQ